MASVAVFTEAYDSRGDRMAAFRAMHQSLLSQTVEIESIHVVGSGGHERQCAEWERVTYHEYPNHPLSRKRQYAMECALKTGATYLMSMGTDDMLHPAYTETALRYIRGQHMTGADAWHVAYRRDGKLMVARNKYATRTDPMGAGRMYSASFIRQKCPQMWPDGLSRSLDGANARLLEKAGARSRRNPGIVMLLKGDWLQLTPLQSHVGPKKWGGVVTTLDCPLDEWDEWPGVYEIVDSVIPVGSGLITPEPSTGKPEALEAHVKALNDALDEYHCEHVHVFVGPQEYSIRIGTTQMDGVTPLELPAQVMYMLREWYGMDVTLDVEAWQSAATKGLA